MGYLRDKVIAQHTRLVRVLQQDPGLTNQQLRERFGCTENAIRKARDETGIRSPSTEMISEQEMSRSKAQAAPSGPFGNPLLRKKRKNGTND